MKTNLKLSLGGTWECSSEYLTKKIPGIVPGSVYQDLLTNGIIADPFDQDNEFITREIMNYDFSYERYFEINSSQIRRHMKLYFEGIDTLSTIYLNEQEIGTTNNMHLRYHFDVTNLIQEGTNHIRVVLHSPLKFMKESLEKAEHQFYQSHDSVPGYIYLRKGSSMFGWDWGPQLPDAGIWRSVEILAYDELYIHDSYIRQYHEYHNVALEIQNEFFGETKSKDYSLSFELVDPMNENVMKGYESTLESISLHVTNPLLWNPRGYGNQYLYEIKICLLHKDEVIQTKIEKIGLRTVTVEQIKDEYGESFTIVVNGHKVFAKGANYIPEDNLLGRTTPEKTRNLLQSAVDANHNIIRVWGGGIYPPNSFYDTCDELGLLVWQDLMFACSVYDLSVPGFKENIEAEVIDNLKRMRNHPSIALVCGNNENETAIEHWNVPSKELSKEYFIEQYETIIRPLVEKYYPNIFYWRSSPSSNELFVNSNSDHYGDMHYWGVWHATEPITYYRKYFPRFMSEFGLQSFPALETVESFAREEDLNIFSYIMEKHQKNSTANGKILHYISTMFKYPKDFQSLLYISQIIQAEGVRYGVEHWRRNYGQCMGVIYWQLNDCWPVASWSSIDYFQRWKALHYHSKRFYQDILVSIEETKNTADIYVTNDTFDSFTADVHWKRIKLNGTVIEEGVKSLLIPASGSIKIKHLDIQDEFNELRDEILVVKLIRDGLLISENSVSFVPDKYLLLKQPVIHISLKEKEKNWALTLSSNTLAKFVEVKIKGYDIITSNNYFNLLPNESYTIYFESSLDKEALLKLIQVQSLFDSY